MRLLLDTHAFLWFIDGNDELSEHAKRLIKDPANERFLSIVSLWEMAIKVSIGKLDVPLPFTRLNREHVEGNAIEVLPIRAEHLDEQRKLPFHHGDPFDRLIIAQAIAEEMKVISRDEEFGAYPAECVWSEGE